jgi:membrane protein implicated in regulation of membrane protease activity
MAAFSIYLVTTHWEANRGKAYMFIFFAILAVFMFFFKRKFRKMTQQRNKDQNKK